MSCSTRQIEMHEVVEFTVQLVFPESTEEVQVPFRSLLYIINL